MKIGVLTFRGSIAPRADIAEALCIFEVNDKEYSFLERVELFLQHPFELAEVLRAKGIEALIASSSPRNLVFILESIGIRVFHTHGGSIEDAVKGFIKGNISPFKTGFFPSPPRRLRKRMRKGKKWRKQ